MKRNTIKEFSERLKELREEKNISLEKLSKAVGIGTSSLSRWENQQADVKGSQLDVLADFFGVTVDFLLGRED